METTCLVEQKPLTVFSTITVVDCTYLQQVEHNFEQMGVLPKPGLSQHDRMKEVEGAEMIPSAQVGFIVWFVITD